MPMQVRVTITGDKEVERKLKRIGKGINDMSAAMKSIGHQTATYYAGPAYASQGGVFKAKWAPLATATIRSRNRRSRSGGSALSRSYTPMISGAANGMKDSFVFETEKMQVIVTNTKDYFKYHQSTRPRRKLPRRQMIGINSAVRNMVQTTIKADIEDKIRRA